MCQNSAWQARENFCQNDETNPPSEGGTKGGFLNQESMNILTKFLCRLRSSFTLKKGELKFEHKEATINEYPCKSVS